MGELADLETHAGAPEADTRPWTRNPAYEQSLAAIGPDALSAAAARAAAEAGMRQARQEITALHAIWPSRTRPAACQ